MKKRIFGIITSIILVFIMCIMAYAAEGRVVYGDYSSDQYKIEPTKVTIKDVERIITKVLPDMIEWEKTHPEDKLTAPHKKEATIINAIRIDDTHLVVRFQFGKPNAIDTISEDFEITTEAYGFKKNGLNNAKKYYMGEEEVPTYKKAVLKYGTNPKGPGKSCFFFGLFDESQNNEICGFGIAKRTLRWAKWNSKYNGTKYEYKYSDTLDFMKIFENIDIPKA